MGHGRGELFADADNTKCLHGNLTSTNRDNSKKKKKIEQKKKWIK